MQLSRLWVALLTSRKEDAGTESKVSLSINVGGRQLLNQIFPESILQNQEGAEADLYEFNVEDKRIDPGALTDSSVSLQILGSDAWKPEHFFAWGEVPPTSPVENAAIFPLVIETNITEALSTDTPDEGVPSIPLRLVAKGSDRRRIRRLLVLSKTDLNGFIADTDNSLEIQIVSNDRLSALCEIRDTAQEDLEAGAANFYTMPVIVPFIKSELNNQSITLRIKGSMDSWLPTSFFVFGLDDAAGRPEAIVPLVYLPRWPFGFMRPDSTNGIASINLPLVQENNVSGDLDEDGGILTLRSIEAGQQTTNRLLEQLVAKLR